MIVALRNMIPTPVVGWVGIATKQAYEAPSDGGKNNQEFRLLTLSQHQSIYLIPHQYQIHNLRCVLCDCSSFSLSLLLFVSRFY